MNDDYLWDKTGEPDPEIQELEQILGTLRYQAQPLKLPRELSVPRRRNYFPLLAIAASVLLALIAAGVWLRVRNHSEPQPQEARALPAPAAVEEKTPAQQTATVDQNTPLGKPAPRKEGVGVNNRRSNRTVAPMLAKREREEALAAKQQLMLALRLASEKLNLVQRKTQTPTPPNQIKNQHRVG